MIFNPYPAPEIWGFRGFVLFSGAPLPRLPMTFPEAAKWQDVAQEGGHAPPSRGEGCRGRTLPVAVGSSRMLGFLRL